MPNLNARDALRAVSSALETPVVIILLLLLAAAVFLLGTLAVEAFTHRAALRKRREKLLSQADTERRAIELVKAEKARCEWLVKLSDMVTKLGPMFGLLGTLIPLGPGIIALGRGDTFTLSQSLLTAFDTTVAGLIAAAVAFVVSTVRKRWYSKHMAALESEMEAKLDEK